MVKLFLRKRNKGATEPPTQLAADKWSEQTKRIGAKATERESGAGKEV